MRHFVTNKALALSSNLTMRFAILSFSSVSVMKMMTSWTTWTRMMTVARRLKKMTNTKQVFPLNILLSATFYSQFFLPKLWLLFLFFDIILPRSSSKTPPSQTWSLMASGLRSDICKDGVGFKPRSRRIGRANLGVGSFFLWSSSYGNGREITDFKSVFIM